VTALAIAAAFALALTMGMADAGNASANLASARLGSIRKIFALAFVSHVAGAVLSGTAVATAVLSAIDVPAVDVITVMAAGSVAAVVLLVFASRAGIPISAGLALVGALAGAAWNADGRGAVVWGGLHGIKPYGVLGAALAMVVAPALGISAAVVGRRVVGRVLKRASRQMRHPLHATLWISSGLVGFADGTNDGQKAMAVITAVLVASGSATAGDIPFWVRLTVGVTLAVGTLLGARVLRTVSRRLYPSRPLDAVTAETTSAVVILASSVVGAPVSTTAVVASGVVGTGLAVRPHHVHWATVLRIGIAWAASLPVSMAAGAAVFAILDAVR
jgi:PiT family inorganic phosphate transporter